MAEKEYKLGKQIIREDDLEFTVEYKGENFVLKYPTPVVQSTIYRNASFAIGAVPRPSVPMDYIDMVDKISYLDQIVIKEKSPSWLKDQNSFWECLDEGLIEALWEGFSKFRDSFRARIQKDGFAPPMPGNRA